jgi:hypothetical protein
LTCADDAYLWRRRRAIVARGPPPDIIQSS